MVTSTADWSAVAEWLGRAIGYELPPEKHYLLQSACRELLARYGCGSPEMLAARASGDDEVRAALIAAVTIHESQWFRDAPLWEILRGRLLPELAAETRFRGSISVLSCGCGYGQEPYSLAMLASEAGIPIAITAVDVDEECLRRARAGRYSEFEISRGLPEAARERWFERRSDGWQLQPCLRGEVAFRQLNLARPFDLPQRFDLILCRNVLIYFAAAARAPVLQRLGHYLAGYGYLALGSAETTWGISDCWLPRMVGGWSFYQRRY